MGSLPKLAVLVSGQGSNLQSIIDHIQLGELKAEISVVISNNESAFALDRAKKAKIPTFVISHKKHQERSNYDRALMNQIEKSGAQWVILAGFMRILGNEFISKFTDKIINIHPSLLPKYPGLHPIEKALSNGDTETGVTVHYVNEGVDSGPVIMQQAVSIQPQDNLETLKAKIQALEHQIYPKALQKVLWGKQGI